MRPREADRGRHSRRQQLDQPEMPSAPLGTTVDKGASVRVLRGDPGLNFRASAILEPAVRVGNLHTVKDIDNRFAAGNRRAHGRVRTVSRGRSWASCRGSPCCGASWPCASSSFSTWETTLRCVSKRFPGERRHYPPKERGHPRSVVATRSPDCAIGSGSVCLGRLTHRGAGIARSKNSRWGTPAKVVNSRA